MGFSPFFMNLLRRNKHPHPLIYMRGVKSIDLVPIVDFLYFGEANVYQENLDSFLAVAEELQLKGLMGSDAGKKVEELNNTSTTKKKALKPLKQRIFTQQEALTPNKSSSVAKVKPLLHKKELYLSLTTLWLMTCKIWMTRSSP